MLKTQVCLLGWLCLFSVGSTWALGLGDIELKSNLNDPLDAEIRLIQLQGLSAGEILPTLASNDDFRRAGVERSFFLSNIEFRVVEAAAGDLRIRLSTRQAVREPFLNFLVEVNWPSGRLLKEYTVLLDPPVFDTGLAVDALDISSTEPPQADLSAPEATDITTATVIDAELETLAAEPAPSVRPQEQLAANEYRVQRNDTLWEVALLVPERSGFSPQQVMLAIQDLNPDAFLQNNINRLKAGSLLTLPIAAQISTRRFQEAIEEVAAQNNGASRRTANEQVTASEVQLSATEQTASALPTAVAEKNPDGYLELTPESQSRTTSASGEAAATIDQLQNQLTVAEELNDQYARETTDLESRVAELQNQIAIMERLLDVQNSNLAEVQQALTDAPATGELASAPAEVLSPEDSPLETAAVSVPEEQASESNEQPLGEEVASAAEVAAPVETVAPQPAPPPTPIQAPRASASTLDNILGFVSEMTRPVSDWIYDSVTNMAITGASLLILMLLPFSIRGRKAKKKRTKKAQQAESVAYSEESEQINTDYDDALLMEVDDDAADEVVADEPEVIDAVVEAEMYTAYQKYDQAEEKLKGALAEYPKRPDIALKLLEVYAETANNKGFNELEASITFNAEDQGEVAALRARLLEMSGAENTGTMLEDAAADIDLDVEAVAEAYQTPSDDEEIQPATNLNSALDFASPEVAEDDSIEPVTLELDEGLEAADGLADDEDLDFSLNLSDLEADEEPLELENALDFASDESLLDAEDDNAPTTAEEPDFGLDFESDPAASAELPPLLDEQEMALDPDAEDETASLLAVEEEIDIAPQPPLEEPEPLDDEVQDLDDTQLDDDDFDFLSGSDEASTKLDLARAYIEMEDKDGARDILEEVAEEGDDDQRAQAKDLLAQLPA